MKLAIYLNYTPSSVKSGLEEMRASVGPGGTELSPLWDYKSWSVVGERIYEEPKDSMRGYCDALLMAGLARDIGYTRASRGFMWALGVTTVARKAYQRALLAALNGVT